MKQKRPEWYTSFHYPYGWCITNGEKYLEPFYYWSKVKPTFVYNLDDAGFFLGMDSSVKFILRYLNIYWR